MSITWDLPDRGDSVEISVDFNMKTMNIYIYIYIYIYIRGKNILFSVDMRIVFIPEWGMLQQLNKKSVRNLQFELEIIDKSVIP